MKLIDKIKATGKSHSYKTENARLSPETKLWLAIVFKEVLDSKSLSEARRNAQSWIDRNDLPIDRIQVFKGNGNGMTQEALAKKLEIDRTTVAKRVSLLKIDANVRKKLESVPHITLSHLEILSPLEVEAQKILLEYIDTRSSWREDGNITVREFKEYTERAMHTPSCQVNFSDTPPFVK
jgi:hypothetical protein